MANQTAKAKRVVEKVTEKLITTKKISLEGLEGLRAERITTTFEVTQVVNANTGKVLQVLSRTQIDEQREPLFFELTAIDPMDIRALRKARIPSFLLKTDNQFYYSKISKDMSFYSSNILGGHQCTFVGKECARISAASDERGGCAKIREGSKRIERYPWIKVGYETFNTHNDAFVVIQCSHYVKSKHCQRSNIVNLEQN